jgi:hypothetical protein
MTWGTVVCDEVPISSPKSHVPLLREKQREHFFYLRCFLYALAIANIFFPHYQIGTIIWVEYIIFLTYRVMVWVTT